MTDLVDFLYGGGGGAKRYSFDDALKAEGVSGKLAEIARSIYEQESSSGKNTATSNAGAVGHMQIIPATFNRFADKGWSANNPEHNMRTGLRYLKFLEPLAGGKPELIGAGYYGGEGAIPLAAQGKPLRDPLNPNAPDTLQYGKKVASRLPQADLVDWLYAENTGTATAKPEQQIYIPTQTGGDPRLQQRDPAAAQQRRESMPALNTLMDFAQGASTVGRGGLNLINQVAPNSGVPAQGRSDLVSPGMTGAKLAGSVLDPGALLVGGAIGKAVPYAPVLGNGFMGGARALGQNLAGGAAVGAPLGALNAAAEDANVTQGATLGATVGAAANVVLPPTIKALGNLAGKAFDMLRGKYGDVIAGKILREASGPDLQRIKQMAANAPADETAAQATAGANKTRIAALGDFAARQDSDYFTSVAGRQNQARLDALAGVAGGDTQTASQQAQQAVRGELNAITTPIRNTELAAANTGKLDVTPISQALRKSMTQPGTRVNDDQKYVLSAVDRKLAEARKLNNGIVDTRDLYEIRKNTVNEAITKLIGGKVTPEVQKKRTAELLAEVKPLIDEAIEKAGGTGWVSKYLKPYEAGARIGERQELGAVALGYAKDAPAELVKLARGDKPEVVSKIFMGENDVQASLGKQFPIVQKAANEIERDQTLAQNANKGAEALNNLLDKYKPKFRIPNWFNPAVTASNRGLQRLEDRVGAKTAEALTNAMKSGKSFAEAINLLPLQDRNKALLAIKEMGANPTLRAAGLNSLLSEQK